MLFTRRAIAGKIPPTWPSLKILNPVLVLLYIFANIVYSSILRTLAIFGFYSFVGKYYTQNILWAPVQSKTTIIFAHLYFDLFPSWQNWCFIRFLVSITRTIFLDSCRSKITIREGCKKSKWKFLMAFAIRGGGSRGGLVCH